MADLPERRGAATPSRTPARLRRVGTAAALLLLLPAAGAAQAAAPGLALDDVVAAALDRSRGIAAGRLRVDAARADLLGARGAFDTRLLSTVGESHGEQRVFDASGDVASGAVSSRRSSYAVGAVRELRSGVVLEPGLSLSRIDDPLLAPVAHARAGATLGVTVPLAYNRMGRVSRAAEEVARLDADASEHRFRQSVADELREVVSAYWGLLAAHERLEVFRSSEERAGRLLQETRTLVEAEERPAADLNQVRANEASKRMSRLSAEQGVRVARQRLGLAMGLGAGESARLPLPGGPFAAVAGFRADTAETARLVRLALERRPEMAASGLGWRAAGHLRETARAAARPRVDLVVTLGYTGLSASDDLAGSLSPFYRDIPGVNAGIQLQYQAALSNRQARGRELQRAAVLDQQRLALEGVTDHVASGVLLAAAALEQSVHVVAESETAVELYRAAVDNEKRKHELGAATLFDVIVAEDNLTGALLARVDGRLDHALSLADLRYQTGTLVEGGGAGLPFTVHAVSTPP